MAASWRHSSCSNSEKHIRLWKEAHLIEAENLRSMESQDPKEVWVGRDPLGPCSPTPLQWARFVMYQAVALHPDFFHLKAEAGCCPPLPSEGRVICYRQCWDSPDKPQGHTHNCLQHWESLYTLFPSICWTNPLLSWLVYFLAMTRSLMDFLH